MPGLKTIYLLILVDLKALPKWTKSQTFKVRAMEKGKLKERGRPAWTPLFLSPSLSDHMSITLFPPGVSLCFLFYCPRADTVSSLGPLVHQ